MTASRTTYAVSEVERFLFYSIPGSMFLFYAAIFLLLFQKLPIDTGIVAGAVAATIPIGFLIYQGYTGNVLRLYEFVSKRRQENTIKKIKEMLKEATPEFRDDEELYRFAKRLLTYVTNTSPDASYIWRLVGIVNARGACIFSGILAGTVPISYLLYCHIFGLGANTLLSTSGICKITIYYVILIICGWFLYQGIPKVRKQLDVFNEILILRNPKEVKDLVEIWRRINEAKSA